MPRPASPAPRPVRRQVKEQCVAKRKSTASGRDPNESAAPLEGVGGVVDDSVPGDAPAADDSALADDASQASSEDGVNDMVVGGDDEETSLEEDLPGEDLAGDLPDPGPYEIAADEDEAEELDPDTEDEDPEQLVEAEEVALAAKSTAPVRRPRSAKAPVKKDAPTRSRKEATVSVTEQRTGPVTFIRQSISELRKVVWPTGSQLSQYYVVVLIFVIFMIALVGALDLFFGWALLKALG